MAKESWTPYALEPYRQQYLRRRRIISALILLLLLLLISQLFALTTDRQTQISANGRDSNGNTIEIEDNRGNNDQQDHITVDLQPGRVTRAETGQEGSPGRFSRTQAPQFERAQPVNWNFYVLLYGPYALVGLLAWWFGRRRSRHDEVNYGVFKGAMPLETITHSHSDLVFTTKFTKLSVFGRKRSDHLPREITLVEQEVEEG